MSQSLGWIGLGRMGEAMVKKLLQAGYGVKVWDRTRAKAEPLAEVGELLVVVQSLCEIAVLAEKAGLPRHVFLESINNSVLGSMYARYKTLVLTKLNFEQVTFTPKLLLKDMGLCLGLGAGKAHGAAATTWTSWCR